MYTQVETLTNGTDEMVQKAKYNVVNTSLIECYPNDPA